MPGAPRIECTTVIGAAAFRSQLPGGARHAAQACARAARASLSVPPFCCLCRLHHQQHKADSIITIVMASSTATPPRPSATGTRSARAPPATTTTTAKDNYHDDRRHCQHHPADHAPLHPHHQISISMTVIAIKVITKNTASLVKTTTMNVHQDPPMST